jgi:S1-C subfamily serine protease
MQRFKINKSYTVSLIVDLLRYSKVKLGLLLIPSNEKKQGIHIKSVHEGGLAHKSGIENDDIILKIDDKEVHFHKELTNVLENNKSMILTIKRKNQLHKIHINLNNN